ncbi:MAG: Fe-S cluster assembly protein SufD [Caenispirillum bisanense]|nr:Fe-S cluster assembly protein SufD [Caenispirillum bisanense]MCA1972531.1 Fe-S cluster assembly protein SufD [Caenispirillum sp.]
MAETQSLTTATTGSVPAPFAALLERAPDTLPGGRIDWVRKAREEGAKLFLAHGVPTVKVEQWKYTNLRALLKIPFEPAQGAADLGLTDLPAGDALTVDAHVLVFVNGRFAPELSDLEALPAAIRVDSLAKLLETEPHLVEPWFGRLADAGTLPFAALNQAGLLDGFAVRVREGAMIERPVHIVQVSAAEGAPTVHQPRNLIVLEGGASATVLESWIGASRGDGPQTLRNSVTEVHVAPRANLRHYILQNLPETAYSIAATVAKVEEGAVYDSFVLQIGSKLSRHDLRVELAGEHAEAHLNGAYGAMGDQLLDTTSFIDHAVPCCTSNEVYKGVLADTAKGVFQGKILVQRPAQKTDGNQLHKALLLNRGAEVNCKPELEIYADDVKCSHGATAGEMDATALFYLRSRGIDPQTARALLIEGFLDDVVDRIASEPLRQAFADMIHVWQDRRLVAASRRAA